MTEFNRMQGVKRRFFAMRNGVIADTLRRGGSKFRIIFGLNLPQITEIASEIGHDPELGLELWHNNSTRESMILATMLLRPADLDNALIERMIAQIDDCELADMFAHKLLRDIDEKMQLADKLITCENGVTRRIALRLMLQQVEGNERKALDMATMETEINDPATRGVAAQLADEASWRIEQI